MERPHPFKAGQLIINTSTNELYLCTEASHTKNTAFSEHWDSIWIGIPLGRKSPNIYFWATTKGFKVFEGHEADK